LPGPLRDHGAGGDHQARSLLPNVLASQPAKEQGAFEAALIRDGVVMERAKTNFFCVVDGRLRTHPRDSHILPCITLDETPIAIDEIPSVRELFQTGTTTDVMPVVQLDGGNVGDGKPGELTRKLQRVLSESLACRDD